MQIVRFSAGCHISEAAKLLVAQAPAKGEFNEIELVATGGETPDDIQALYAERSAARAAAHRMSPEGIAAENRRQESIKSAQSLHDTMVAQLPALDFKDEGAILDWLCAIQDATDTSGVTVDKNAIILAFAAAGYYPGANCGEEFDENDRDKFLRWVIGQALETLSTVSMHPLVHKFADQWRERFLPA